MCKECVKQPFPERGSTCLEAGAYLVNFVGCKSCGGYDFPSVINKEAEEDEDGEETVTFDHSCKDCGHFVAKHVYTFRVEGKYQEYAMECMLCGNGEQSVSILPIDPAKRAG